MAVLEIPNFLLVAIPAILIAGISKGGFGGGLGVLAVPVLALAVPAPQAAALMLPILCIMDVFGLWVYRGHWHKRILKHLLPAAFAGICIGSLSFKYLNGPLVGLLVGVIAFGFTVDWMRRQWVKNTELAAKPARPFRTVRDSLWGIVAGFTSFVAHAGGPPMNMVLLPQKLDKTTYQATTVVFFCVVNYIKLVPYAFLGQLSASNLELSASLVPIAILGMMLGVWLHKRLSERWFYALCYSLLGLTSLKLLSEGFIALYEII